MVLRVLCKEVNSRRASSNVECFVFEQKSQFLKSWDTMQSIYKPECDHLLISYDFPLTEKQDIYLMLCLRFL